MRFTEKLMRTSRKNNSLLCIGLDTELKRIPSHLQEQPDAVLRFNKAIFDATKDLVQCYKLNVAFYESMGVDGIRAMMDTVKLIQPSTPVIVDAKRNDIGNTARAYAKAVFEVYGFDAATVNPYLGYDSIRPFLEHQDKGTIVLCRTSNPSAPEFQDYGGQTPLYQEVARRVVEWNRNGNCGVVAGATFPDQLIRIRKIVGEHIPILVPGVGAQGADISSATAHAMNSNGELAIINSSRGVIYAGRGEDFAQQARMVAETLRSEINEARSSPRGPERGNI